MKIKPSKPCPLSSRPIPDRLRELIIHPEQSLHLLVTGSIIREDEWERAQDVRKVLPDEMSSVYR